MQYSSAAFRADTAPQCRSYIDKEMQAKTIDSPFSTDGSIVKIFDALLTLKCREGKNISKLVECVEMLARVRQPSPPVPSCLVCPRQTARV